MVSQSLRLPYVTGSYPVCLGGRTAGDNCLADVCVSLFVGCQASAASGSPERHDVFDSSGAVCWWKSQDKQKEGWMGVWMMGEFPFYYSQGI